ncbi:hypothetical protein BASA61_003146 [Batrachochytrium salamandrivorans]|nr:hypothetical protein BASA62_000035 [Batrachochytrium salamandrivorans]KAH6597577.1 hypothetical protein BASA61_003146 [Batrachochytrium salamandrivorans]KAH9248199.1 hypothetical protein BASA81_014159 [Batrachochytrium salamandrivorans]KAJ1328507.1 hypothetical protein BSLG_010239 [Batrachochytrium salamandrivorans]
MISAQQHISEVAVSTSSKDSSIHIWDIRNGALLSSLKGNSSSLLSTGILYAVGNHHTASSASTSTTSMTDASGSYNGISASNMGRSSASAHVSSGLNGWMLPSLILSAQSDRATLNAWSLAKAQPISKSVLPEKLSCLCISTSGRFCLAGGFSGRLYLWEIATGNLLRMFDAHYKPVKVVRFTADDACMISGGEDAMIHVWSLEEVLDESIDHQELPPKLRSLKGHTLPISDLICGLSLHTQTRCFTSSLDKTCKIWDLTSGSMLLTVLFPRPLTCLQINATETTLYAASVDGLVRAVNLYSTSEGGLRGIIEGDIRDADTNPCVFRGHSGSITCMSLSMDETLLVTGSEDGDCIVWDAATRQALRSFKAHKDPVSSVQVVLKPPSVSNPDARCRNTIESFKRFPITRGTTASDTVNTGEVLNNSVPIMPTRGLSDMNDAMDKELYPNAARIFQGFSATLGTSVTKEADSSGRTEVEILRSRITLLEKHNDELRRLNDELYDGAVHTMMDTKD